MSNFELFTTPIPNGLRPQLAAKFDAAKQNFPCFASPKIDGIRALGTKGGLLSRTLKLIPNSHTQARFADCKGLDGELVVGSPTDPNCMQKTSSGVMSKKGQPDVKLYVFDRWDLKGVGYSDRLSSIHSDNINVVLLQQRVMRNQEELDAFEAICIEQGYEGIMVRSFDGLYKMGRSTTNEGGLLKVKRFSHGEARIVGFEELMHNENETYVNELGRDVRSSHAENLVASGRLGAYICYHPDYEGTFGVSCGSMTHTQAKWAWENREQTRGDITRFKHFAHGVKVKPRHGIWAGFRHNEDLGKEHPLWADEKLTKQPATLEFPEE